MIEWQKNPIAALDNLKGALRRKILRKAITRGIRIFRGPLKSAVPVDKGKLRKGVATKVYTSRRKAVVGLIGARVSIAPHLHLVDRGTKDRKTKSGHRTGRVIGQHFMDHVYATHHTQAIDTMRQVCAEEIHNELLKAGSKA